MARVLRTLMYRLLHDKWTYIILAAVVIGSLVMFAAADFYGMGSYILENHETFVSEQHTESGEHVEVEVYTNYEDEDPLIINKLTQNLFNANFDSVPGYEVKCDLSYGNVAIVNILLAMVILVIMAADSMFLFYFFGQIFSDGAIRNMVTVKSRKLTIYFASLLVNILVILVMYVLVFSVITVYILIAGLYPIILVPVFVTAVITGIVVTITVTSFFIFLLFLSHNALISLMLAVLLLGGSTMGFEGSIYLLGLFENRYAVDETAQKRFFEGGYRMLGDKEWYLPVDDFNVGRVYVPSDDLTIEFYTDEPNKDYPGDNISKIGRTLYRSNIIFYPMEMQQWFMYPMYRDGLMTRYLVLSAGYMILLTTLGTYIVNRRDID